MITPEEQRELDEVTKEMDESKRAIKRCVNPMLRNGALVPGKNKRMDEIFTVRDRSGKTWGVVVSVKVGFVEHQSAT